MKKIAAILLVILCVVQCFPQRVFATTGTEEGCNTLQAENTLAGDHAYTGTAKAALLYEMNSQTLVYTHNPDVPINPTGLVKLLTALIVLEEGNLEDIVTVKRSTLNSVGVGAVSAGLKSGEEIRLQDLLYCVMVSSANDAAAVMAEHVAGSQSAFVEKMNARAATLGCGNTHFTNVHGLKDDRQRSTARDLAVVVAEALKNEEFCRMFGIVNYTVPATNMSDSRQLSTTNYMMNPESKYYDERVIGGKPAAATTTDRSMICIAQEGNSRYLCVIISAQAKTSGGMITRYTNFDEAKNLLSMGFEGFALQQVMGTEQPFGLYPVTGGQNHVVVGPDQAVYALLPIDFEQGQLTFRDVPDESMLKAPLKAGVTVGILEIRYGNLLIGRVNLLSRHAVAADDAGYVTPDENREPMGGIARVVILFVAGVLVVLCIGVGLLMVLRRRNRARVCKKGGNHANAIWDERRED